MVKCLMTKESVKTGMQSLVPMQQKDLKKMFKLTASEPEFAHRQLMVRMRVGIAGLSSTLMANETVGGIRVAKSKRGTYSFSLKDMGESEKAMWDSRVINFPNYPPIFGVVFTWPIPRASFNLKRAAR